MSEDCEWNPDEDRKSHTEDPFHAHAVISVGSASRSIHLCESCARLKRFSGLRRRVLLRAPHQDRFYVERHDHEGGEKSFYVWDRKQSIYVAQVDEGWFESPVDGEQPWKALVWARRIAEALNQDVRRHPEPRIGDVEWDEIRAAVKSQGRLNDTSEPEGD